MKKALLVLTLVCFCVSLVCSWFSEDFIWGLGWIFTLVYGLLIYLSVRVLRKHRKVRWWVVIVLAIISLKVLFSSLSALSAKQFQDSINKQTTSSIADEANSKSDELNDENIETETSEVNQENDEAAGQENNEDGMEVSNSENSTEQQLVTKFVEVPVTVEKVVEKKVEVPVEKTVTEYVEVPVVEYVEVETAESPTTDDSAPVSPPSMTYTSTQYTGDPTGRNNGYGYGYTGDPTGGSYGYGDPTGASSYYSYTTKISGPTSVTQGNSYTYTISGVSSISLSNLKLPANVSAKKLSANTVRLTFESGYTGSYSIGYGSSVINVKVNA